MQKILTLCIPATDDALLLGMKKRGFGSGRWNGFGGKVENGETIEAAARRELYEEAGIADGVLRKIGILEFSFESDEYVLEVHIFTLTHFTDEPVETEEMKPQWFSYAKIPFAQMWPDDEYWFPLMRSGTLFTGAFRFDKPSDATYTAQIRSHTLREVPSLE